MPRNIGTQGNEKIGYGGNFRLAVIEAGNEQRRYLQPDARMVKMGDIVKDWLQTPTADFLVKIIGKALQINIDSGQGRRQQARRLS